MGAVSQARPKLERGPAVAGVDLSAGRVRVIVAHREGLALRVTGLGQSALTNGAIVGGLVVDREASGTAIAQALSLAESREKATRIVGTIDGDDVRTFHVVTTFEREGVGQPIDQGELARARAEARAEAERVSREGAGNDPALRGIGTVHLRDDLAGVAVDGRALADPVGFQGRYIEVRTDVSVAPVVLASAATAALEAARRRGTVAPGAYALGRLLAASGMVEGAVLRLGVDVTAFAVVRGSRVVATRAFGLGRDALLARADHRAADASVWASCVSAPPPGLDGPLPALWHFVGVPEELLDLPRALGNAIAGQRGGEVEILPLRPTVATRLLSHEQLHADDLVAAGAAALAADLT
jgi:hypothetical protein